MNHATSTSSAGYPHRPVQGPGRYDAQLQGHFSSVRRFNHELQRAALHGGLAEGHRELAAGSGQWPGLGQIFRLAF